MATVRACLVQLSYEEQIKFQETDTLPELVPFSLIWQRSQSCWLKVDKIPVSILKGPVCKIEEELIINFVNNNNNYYCRFTS